MNPAARLVLPAILGTACALCAPTAFAQATSLDPFVTTGLDGPIEIAVPDDGSGRMFVAEQNGDVKVVDIATQAVLGTYLHVDVTYGGEQGLLAIEFDPNFGINPGEPGYADFYVAFTAPGGGTSDQVLRRYTVSNPASNDAGSASGTDLIHIDDFAVNHNGADIHFGPDGYLYYSMGDGGGGGDPTESADDIGSLLGKIMRIDVHGSTANASSDLCGVATGQNAGYAIPADNPFAGATAGCGEVWLYGLRNPYRFSFDRANGDLWIGDVGQQTYEEVDWLPAGAITERNLGWDQCEGNHYYEASGSGSDCPATTGTLAPVIEYSHSFGCVVTGGYRYRGPVSDMVGKYVYADACSSRIWFASYNGSGWDSTQFDQLSGAYSIVAFGEDNFGNLYAVHQGADAIYKFNGDTDLIFADGFDG